MAIAARYSTWVLAGALLASTGLHFARGAEPTPTAAAPAGAPALELSQEQIERLAACCRGCCSEREEIAQRSAAIEAELRAALAAPRIDRDRATALADELGALRARSLQNAVESISLVRDVLTPAQIEALVKCFGEGCDVGGRE